MSDLEIRLVSKNELKDLLEISIVTFRESYEHLNDPHNFEEHIKKSFNKSKLLKEWLEPKTTFHFAIFNQSIVGYIKLNIEYAQTENMGNDAIELERIYVMNKFKGLGIGKTLIQKSILEGSKLGKSLLWLGVWEKNPSAINFYEHMGFQKSGEHIFMIGDEKQTDFIMELDLKISK